jgi:hypothetical protein
VVREWPLRLAGIDVINLKGRWFAALGLERQGGIMVGLS